MNTRFLTARADVAALLPWLGRLAALVMLGLLAWLGADIFWTLNAPPSVTPSALMETDVQRAQQGIANRHLFGQYVAAATGGASVAPSNLRLSGVIAAQKPGQRAYALITVEGKPAQLVREGDEIAPGLTLQRVLARQVELLRGGQSQTLSLPESGKTPTVVLPLPDNPKAAAVAEAPPAAAPEIPKPQVVAPPLPQSGPPPPRRSRNRRSTEE